jgi:transcriptional regulator with XRE-family HTH domain
MRGGNLMKISKNYVRINRNGYIGGEVENMDMRKIGSKLTSLRKENNLTLEEVSEKISLSSMAISRYENGQRQPKLAILEQLSQIYMVPLSEIIAAGETKNMSEIYQLDLQKEVATELVNIYQGELGRKIIKDKIDIDDRTNSLVDMVYYLEDMKKKISKATSIDEIKEVTGFIKHSKALLLSKIERGVA